MLCTTQPGQAGVRQRIEKFVEFCILSQTCQCWQKHDPRDNWNVTDTEWRQWILVEADADNNDWWES